MNNNILQNYQIDNKVFGTFINQTVDLANKNSFIKPNVDINNPVSDTVELSTKPKKTFLNQVKDFFKKDENGKITNKQKLVMAGGGALVAGVLGAVYFIKKGDSKPFTKPFVKRISDAKLDKMASKTINSISLKNGFSGEIKNQDELKKALEGLFPNAKNDAFDGILQRYSKDKNTVDALRILTGDNLRYSAQIGDLTSFFHQIGDAKKINMDDFSDFVKLKTLDEDVLPMFNMGMQYRNYAANPRETKRFIALIEKINKKAEYNTIKPFAVLRKDKFNPRDTMEFLYTLKNDTVGHRMFTLQNLIADEAFDPKVGVKFLNDLDKDIIGNVKFKSIANILISNDIDAGTAVQKLNKIPKEIIHKFKGDSDAMNYLRFSKYASKTDISELTLDEKKDLMQRLIKNADETFGSGINNEVFPLLPKNKEEYCELLQKLAQSIGISTKPLSAAEKTTFNKGLKNIMTSLQNANLNDVTISLDNSRSDFIKKVSKTLDGLNNEDKRKITGYFGFEIASVKKKDDTVIKTLKGYPVDLSSSRKAPKDLDKKTKEALDKVTKLVKDFSENNTVKLTAKNSAPLTAEQKALENDLNDILAGLPEFRSIIGRKQHGRQAYSLDEHTLRVVQGCITNPKFAKLSKEDKKVLTIASLMHDFTKTEGIVDKLHPVESAFDAYYILKKFDLTEDEQLKVYELIKSHDWLEKLNKASDKPEKFKRYAQDVAFETRHTNTFELSKILCESDIKAVEANGVFFDEDKQKAFKICSKEVEKCLDRIHSTQIMLPQVKIPPASKIKNGVQKMADGIENTVIYMDKLDDDLSKYGFEAGATKENCRALAHAIARDDKGKADFGKLSTTSLIESDAVLSASYINPRDYRTYYRQGLLLDTNPSDILAGYCKDFGSGYGKNTDLIKADYLFAGQRKCDIKGWFRRDRTEFRDYISHCIKEELGTEIARGKKVPMDDKDYIELMRSVSGCKSITDIRNINSNLADALEKVFNLMETGKRHGGRQYNEMLVCHPRIKAVYAYGQSYESIPRFLRKYAHENDLPIVIFGK